MTRYSRVFCVCNAVLVMLTLLAAFVLSGCLRVKPHQRERLARPSMQQPVWPAVEKMDQHTFRVREGSNGASGDAGGGCGCN